MRKLGIYQAGKNQTSFGYESGTYGGAVSGAAQWIGLVQDFAPDDNQNIQRIRYHGTDSRNVSKSVEGAEDYGGEVTFYPQDFKMLMFALGNITDTTTGSPTFYTHTISELNSCEIAPMTSGARCPFTSFTLESVQQCNPTGGNFGRTYKGCNVVSYTLSKGDASEPLTCTVGFIAQDMTFASGAPALDPTALTRRPYIPSDTLVHLPSGNRLDVKTWDFNLNNTVDRDSAHVCNGSRVIAAPTATEREYEFSFTMDGTSAEAARLYGIWKSGGQVENNLLLAIENFGGTSGTSIITMSGCDIDAFDAPNPVEGIDEWSLTVIPKTVSAVVQDQILKYKAW